MKIEEPLAKRLTRKALHSLGYTIQRAPGAHPRFGRIYDKYKDRTMCSRESYVTNLELASMVTTPGCVIECGVWKGGSSAGMAEVLGPDREYFLFDSFQGHVDAQPVDGPAAFAWQADKSSPIYFDNCTAGMEDAETSMQMSGAKHYKLVKGWFDDTLRDFRPPAPIAVLRIDCDWHAGTLTCLRALFPYLAEDGIMIADGYPDWDGYARAIHEYLAEYQKPARLKQRNGLYYIVKGAREWDIDSILGRSRSRAAKREAPQEPGSEPLDGRDPKPREQRPSHR